MAIAMDKRAASMRRFKITWFLLGQGAFACTPKAGLASIDKRLVILSEVADREANGHAIEESLPRTHTLRPAREFHSDTGR
jgi:hypothetical protein